MVSEDPEPSGQYVIRGPRILCVDRFAWNLVCAVVGGASRQHPLWNNKFLVCHLYGQLYGRSLKSCGRSAVGCLLPAILSLHLMWTVNQSVAFVVLFIGAYIRFRVFIES